MKKAIIAFAIVTAGIMFSSCGSSTAPEASATADSTATTADTTASADSAAVATDTTAADTTAAI